MHAYSYPVLLSHLPYLFENTLRKSLESANSYVQTEALRPVHRLSDIFRLSELGRIRLSDIYYFADFAFTLKRFLMPGYTIPRCRRVLKPSRSHGNPVESTV